MPAKAHTASATSIYDRRVRHSGVLDLCIFRAATRVNLTSGGMDEALKAGIGATVCSVFILAIVLAALHGLPVGIG